VGGLAGTALLTAVVYVAAVLGYFDFVVFEEVGSLVGILLPGSGESVVVGYLVYLLGSTTAWALLYVAVVDHIPRERGLTKGVLFGLVLLPAGKVAAGKVAQAALHGARILEVDGNFDACLDIVQELAARGEAYLLNSLNPFRLEGQKTIGFEILEQFRDEEGEFPDRIVLPVGNAGNTAALYKCFRELVRSGALDADDVPKLTGVQAEG
ncbi:pyridoxal-phosphate dependent enzyme, partial [Halobium palmae]